jgi:hypothetical protein
VKVQVITPEEMRERNDRFRALRNGDSRMMRNDWELAEQAERGTALFFWHEPAAGGPLGAFSWLCPGCGS